MIHLQARGKGVAYHQRLKNICGSSLIAYYRMNEAAGPTAVDSSGNGLNGTYTNATFSQAGIGDGFTSVAFATTRMNLYSAGFVAAFNGNEGFIHIRANVTNWLAGTNRTLCYFRVDGSNRIFIQYSSANNTIVFSRLAGGTTKSSSVLLDQAGFLDLVFTWSRSNDRQRVYINGVQKGLDVTGLGLFAGTLNSNTCLIGGQAADADSSPFVGKVAHVAIGNAELDPASVWALGNTYVNRTGAVLFRFDTGYVSIIDSVYPIFSPLGLKGNVFVHTDLVGTAGCMTWADYLRLNADGWDIANHTKTGTNLTTLTAPEIDDELTLAKNAIDAQGMTRASMHVSYPYGGVNATVRTEMGTQGMLTGILASGFDYNAMPKTSVLTDIPDQYIRDTTLLADIKNMVLSALMTNQVAILLIHDPGSAGNITLADFQLLVDYIVSNSIPVITISEYYARYLA